MRWPRLALSILIPLASALPTRGAADPPVNAPAPISGEMSLSLAEAITRGIENNLDVEVARHDPLIALEEASAVWGAYDPESFSEFGYSDIDTPVASSLQSSSQVSTRTRDGRTGFRGLVPWLGASYELSYSGQETKTNLSIQTLSPEFTSNVVARATLPLLRDLIWSEPWTRVKVAGISSEAAREEFRRTLMDTLKAIEDAYWDLMAREQDQRVASKSLETARALREQVRAQFEVGVVSKVEVVEADAGVADREFALIVAENAYRSAEDRLIDLVLGPHLTPRSRLDLRLTEPPEQVTIRDVDVEAATQKALTRRPVLALARKEIERREIELRFARNQRLPRLNVEGSYGYEGLAGRRNPNAISFGGAPALLTVGSRFWDADDDFFGADGSRQWGLRGLFSIPLGNVEGRHNTEKAALELRKASARERRVEQQIVLEIREAARNLASSLEGIDAAARRGEAASEQLRAERVRLEHGESTPFDVLQREEDLVEAQQQKITAQRAYRQAVTQVERTQGTILNRHNVVVDRAGALR